MANSTDNQKGGRPLRYQSVQEMIDKIAGFEDWCKETGRAILIEWLMYYLEIDQQEKAKYLLLNGVEDNGEYNKDNDYSYPLKRACDLCTSWLANNGVVGTWRDAVTIFLLKQQGYTDRTEMSVDSTIRIEYPDDELND